MDLGHWVLRDGLDYIPDMFGFVYRITDNINGKKYIGKKQCLKQIKRPPLKGKKRARRDVVQSDWRSYTGSCQTLNDNILARGKENFTFEILMWCDSKFTLAYYEIKIQLLLDVVLRDDYYNGIVNCRLGVKNTEKYEKNIDLSWL